MKNEELNKRLADRLKTELEEYRKEYLSLSKEEMLERYAEYYNRCEIVKAIPLIDNDLFKAEYYEALLATEHPLEMIACEFDEIENDWSAVVEDIITEIFAPEDCGLIDV